MGIFFGDIRDAASEVRRGAELLREATKTLDTPNIAINSVREARNIVAGMAN